MTTREPELYKDKVEVSLDGRQIFYLFFGGAVVVGMVFVLGVLVGRRVEARGHIDQARTHTATDPLAALDRLEGSGGLSFQGALTGKDTPSTVEKTIDDLEKSRAAKPADKPEAKVEAKPEAKAELKTEAKTETKPADKTEAKAEAKAKADAASGPVVKPDADKKADKKADKAKADKAKADKADKADKSEAKAEPKVEAKAEPKDEPKVRYTLQLSSFQDRSEAEAYLSAIKAQGFSAQITQAEVEGKGTFYRVRLGTYRSMEAANSAKAELADKAGKSASVMKL